LENSVNVWIADWTLLFNFEFKKTFIFAYNCNCTRWLVRVWVIF